MKWPSVAKYLLDVTATQCFIRQIKKAILEIILPKANWRKKLKPLTDADFVYKTPLISYA